MSVPYGQPPAAPQREPASSSGGGPGLGKILAIATGGLGLVIYLLSFADDAGGYLRGLLGILLLGGGLLAAASVLPKAPATLVPATVTVVTSTLFLLIDVAKGPTFLGTSGVALQVPGLAIVVLVLAFLESVAGVLALLVTAGLVNLTPRPSPFPQPSWGPQQPGYSGPAAQGAYPAPGGYPNQGHQVQGYPVQGYSGQQPVGPPSGGYPLPPPQPYVPHTVHYRSLQDQYGQPQYGSQPGQYGGSEPGQHGGEPGQYGGGEPGLYGGSEPGQHGGGERGEADQPGEPGGRPGTPPGSP